MIKYLLDPMNDERLTASHCPYEVWHYMLVMEWHTQALFTGFELPSNGEDGYYRGNTPKAFALSAHAQFTMQIIDAQNPFAQWLNNWALTPGDISTTLGKFRGASCRMGKDDKGFVLQIWYLNVCVEAFRFDVKAPNPPGWREKVIQPEPNPLTSEQIAACEKIEAATYHNGERYRMSEESLKIYTQYLEEKYK